MKEKALKGRTFIQDLFINLVLKTNKEPQSIDQNKLQSGDESLGFYDQLQLQIETCKSQIKEMCSKQPYIQEGKARKIINALMYLTKDLSFLLEDGILNLYMDLVQLKKQRVAEIQVQSESLFIEKIIQSIQPLLYQFCTFRQYKKKQNQRLIAKNSSRKSSFTRRFSAEADQSQILPKSCNNISIFFHEYQIQKIRKQFITKKLKQLLDEFLHEYQIQLNDLQQTCKICSKRVKITHLQQHVQYCQKKYILKQDLKSKQNRIVHLAEQLLLKQKIGNPTENEQKLVQILHEILRIHKINLVINQNSRKLKETIQKYEDIIIKLDTYLGKNHQNNRFYEQTNLILDQQKQTFHLLQQIREVQIEHENLRQILSTSTIRPPSIVSNRVSEKKSRFAKVRNVSRSSKNSQAIQIKEDQAQKQQVYESQGMSNQEQFQLDQSPGKTKKSFDSCDDFQFDVDYYDVQQRKRKMRAKSPKRKRRIMSLVILDSESQSDQDQDQDEGSVYDEMSQSVSRPEQIINLKEFEVLKFIGKGAFGKVFAVRKKNTKDLYALKMINIGQNWGPKQFEQVKNQHEIFKKVAGEHLVQAPFCFTQGGVHIFMMQFMSGGDLSKVLKQQVYLQEQRAKKVIAQIVLAIQHLHNAGIIHRDLKPQNLVIDDRGHLKLTDFGLSEIKIQDKMQKVLQTHIDKEQVYKPRRKERRTAIRANKYNVQLIGTPDYIAPQIINGVSIHNKSIDWWSLGVISYEIMVGVRPFCGNTIEEILDNILKLKIEWPEIGSQQGEITQTAYDFIRRLLDSDFMNRLGAKGPQQIKSHPFFQGIDWENIKQKPASITPNYTKTKQLLEMDEDQQLRAQIQQKMGSSFCNLNMPKLDDFIRFDYLGQRTVKQAKKVISKKNGTLKRLRSLKQFIVNNQNDLPTQNQNNNILYVQDNRNSQLFAQVDKQQAQFQSFSLLDKSQACFQPFTQSDKPQAYFQSFFMLDKPQGQFQPFTQSDKLQGCFLNQPFTQSHKPQGCFLNSNNL